MRKLFVMIMVLALICAQAFAEPAVYEGSTAEVAANVLPAMVTVTAVSGEETSETVGAYVRASDEGGYVICPHESVYGAETISMIWSDGTETEAEYKGGDASTGIAVLEFKGECPDGSTPIGYADSDKLTVGEQLIVISRVSAAGQSFNAVSYGMVSALTRETLSGGFNSMVTSILAQTQASGGFIVNTSGELAGLAGANEGGFAACAPANTIGASADEIIANGAVSRPMLGIGVTDYDGPDDPIRSHPPIGVMVRHIAEGSSAEEEGVQVYDVITEIDGTRIKSYEELSSIVASHSVGDTVTLKAYRYYDKDGNTLPQYEEKTFEIELRELDY